VSQIERIEKHEENSPLPTSDSKTMVYQRLHGQRDVISIRIKPEIKEALNEFCRANGESLCHILEALTTGYLVGMQQKITWVNQSPTMNLTVVRDVKRIRRYAVENDTQPASISEQGSSDKCAHCETSPVAKCVNHRSIEWLCQVHFAKVKSGLSGWRYLRE